MGAVPDLYGALTRRLGGPHLRQRLVVQVEHAAQVFGQGRTLLHIENAEWLMVALYGVLKASGLYPLGRRGASDLRVERHEVRLPGLPSGLDGFTLLHLTDLHLDIDPGHVDVILSRTRGLSPDVTVLTGDYRASTSGPYERAVELTARLVRSLPGPVYGVLGNHDFVEFVPPLEEAGMRFLLNETVTIERGGGRLHLSGIDDPHYYETDNLEKTVQGLPEDEPWILLSHSPEVYRQAAACGFSLLLCGHTHGGQICLPGGMPILTNARCPRAMRSGPWQHGAMRGYTSRGTGSCGVPVRFFCPPEVTLHTLRVA